jgi:DNA-binding LacI/PurR family transcriptional regulator
LAGKPTLKDVAERSGVSRSLVSLALRNDIGVSATTRERILEIAAELGYRPNLNARRLASSHSDTVGVMLADLHNPVYAEILDGFSTELPAPSGPLDSGRDEQQFLLATGFRDPRRERLGLEALVAQQVEGILLMGALSPDAFIQTVAAQVPLVVVGRRVPDVDCVLVDDAAGMRQAVEHLIDLGHRRICHLDGGQGAGSSTRRSAYRAVMTQHGLDDHIEVLPGDYSEHSGRAAVTTLLTEERRGPRPTALVAANDLSAIGVLAAARTHGLRVPEDLSVVGYDNTALAHNGYVEMTTVDYPRHELGAQARDLLTTRMKTSRTGKTRTAMVSPALVVRSTTALASPN